MKVVTDFEAKLLIWGNALREYDEADAVCRRHPGGWPDRSNCRDVRRLDAAGKRLDKLRGPMHTALDRYARYVSKQS